MVVRKETDGFALPEVGRLVKTADPWMPYPLVEAHNENLSGGRVSGAPLMARSVRGVPD
jgi:hypothetical protein